MAHYIISYDLHYERHYQPVWDKLESWGAVRLLESVWVVSLTDSAGAVRGALETIIDKDDSVAVIELQPGSNWSALRARKPGTDWLTRNIRRYP